MLGLIVLDGEKPSISLLQNYLSKDNILICADGGGSWLYKHGIVPDYLVGDMDSISKEALTFYKSQSKTKILSFNSQKDETDGQIAIDIAIDEKCNEIVIFAGIGNRIDHSLGNIQLLLRSMESGINTYLVADNTNMFVVNDLLSLAGEKDDIVSIIPFKGTPSITTAGLQYPLYDQIIPASTPLGISNVIVEGNATITVSGGWIIVVHIF